MFFLGLTFKIYDNNITLGVVLCEYSTLVVCKLPKLERRVRFPLFAFIKKYVCFFG